MRRFFTFSLIALFSLLCLLALLLWLILATERGTAWAWSLAQDFLPERLQTEKIRGRLAGPLYLDGLTFSSDAMTVQLEHAELDWSPLKLLKSSIRIKLLQINGLHITRTAVATNKTDPEKSFRLPEEIQLPVNIELEHIELNDFQYRAGATADPFIIDQIKLETRYAGNHLAIKTLQASSPLFDIDAQASLDTQGDYPLSGEIHWQARQTGYATIDGRTRIQGDMQQLAIDSLLDAPYNLTASVELKQPLSNLTASIELATESFTPKNVQPEWPDMPFKASARGLYQSETLTMEKFSLSPAIRPGGINANGTINLSGAQPLFDVALNWQHMQWPLTGSAEYRSKQGKLKVTGTPEKLAADLFAKINATGKPEGEITGRINRRDERIHLALSWKDLVLPAAETAILLPKGKAELQGTLDDYLLQLDTALDAPDQTSGYINVTGRGNRRQLKLGKVDIQALQGELKGAAQITWKPAMDIALNVIGKDINPGVLFSEWPGRLMPTIQLQAANKDGAWRVQTQQTRIKGELRGYPVDLTARASLENNILDLTALHLKSGESRLQLKGTIDKQFNLEWQLDSNNLGEVWPRAQGALQGTGKITGAQPWPQISASLHGNSILLGTLAAKSVTLETQLDSRLQDSSALHLQLEDGSYGDIHIASAELQASGIAARHTATLKARTSQGDLDLGLQGVLDNPLKPNQVWRGTVNRATLSPPDYAGWQLEQAVRVLASKKKLQIESACWTTTPTGRLCLKGTKAEDFDALLLLTDLPLDYFRALYPPDMQLQGSLNGNAVFSRKHGDSLRGKAELTTTAGQLLQSDASSPRENEQTEPRQTDHQLSLLSFSPSRVQLQLDDKVINMTTALQLQGDDQLSLDLSLPNNSVPLMEREISGHIQASLDDLSFIDVLSYEIDQAKGQLTSDFQLSGQLGKPLLTGQLELSNFSAHLLQPGLSLENGLLTLTGNGQQGLTLKAAVTSGEGRLIIDGKVNLREEHYADISLSGDNITVTDTPDAHVIASPELKLGISKKYIKLTGRLIIPYADITPRKLPESAVTVSSDQIIVKPGQQDSQQTFNRDLLADLYLILGNDVRIDSLGLKAEIAGAVRIQEEPGEPATGSGELKIMKGEYKAYGQDLTIEQGRILFTGGPISRPGIDIRATRKPREDITVGIQVRGSLTNTDFTLFSTPSMTQQFQLSYLIFGRPPNETSGAENSALSRAIMALGMKGGDFLTKNIGKHIGIDEIGIQSTTSADGSEQAALMLGKYLSPKIYVSYGLGLFEPVSTFKLEYFINRKWRFVTESSGVRTGGDIFYSIERGD